MAGLNNTFGTEQLDAELRRLVRTTSNIDPYLMQRALCSRCKEWMPHTTGRALQRLGSAGAHPANFLRQLASRAAHLAGLMRQLNIRNYNIF